jgi:hypothetical protein
MNHELPTKNYFAKQTQFFKKSNVYNLNKNKKLQQKMDNGHLVKTNPNKPNLWCLPCEALFFRAKKGACQP